MDRSMALLSLLSLGPRGLVSPRIGARKAQCDGVCRGYQSRLLRIAAEELPLGTRDQKLVSTHSSIFRILSPRSMCCKNARQYSPRIRSPANSVQASRDARPPSSSRRAGPASRLSRPYAQASGSECPRSGHCLRPNRTGLHVLSLRPRLPLSSVPHGHLGLDGFCEWSSLVRALDRLLPLEHSNQIWDAVTSQTT